MYPLSSSRVGKHKLVRGESIDAKIIYGDPLDISSIM